MVSRGGSAGDSARRHRGRHDAAPSAHDLSAEFSAAHHKRSLPHRYEHRDDPLGESREMRRHP
eukprot:CAMPEP_0194293772 /NCGR_PEP_ID=MMETSP0169-20130528/48620_1 /TAXON_ID=218684 /ORGANISM="Corethron pennatum, Strain L29A3" /LENGTH=62 /DNA_ID=CAMNT_0039042405 /DNA_START=74 /DNA_END=259 /DNA_ORIENTATION=+